MDRRQGSPVARRALAAAALALAAAGCGGHSNVQFSSSGSPSTGVSSGGSVRVQGGTTVGVLFAIAVLAGASHRGDQGEAPAQRAPDMEPARRVGLQDCTRPIEDPTANLKCR